MVKIIKCLKVLQRFSDHKESLIREPYTVLGEYYKHDSIVSVDMDKVGVIAAYSARDACV